MKKTLRIAICGCGTAGLASALFLTRSGHRVTLFERFTVPRPVGSGLILQPTGLAVLDTLGLLGELSALGAPIERLYGRAVPSNRVALDVRYRALGAGWRALAVHRAALFNTLFAAAQAVGVTMATGKVITGVQVHSASISPIDTASEPLGNYDLVVDALGANSPLATSRVHRTALCYGALWTNIPWPTESTFDPNALEQRYRSARQMAGVLPIGRPSATEPAQAAFFWSIKRQDVPAWRMAKLEQWREQVAALWPEAASQLTTITHHEQLTFAQYDHFTMRQPCSDRLVHIGDSAHATSPQLGQGANMALLDAMALACAIDRNDDVADALTHYARMRRWHVRLFQTASAVFTPFYQSDSDWLPRLRDYVAAPMSQMPLGDRLLSRLVSGMTISPLRGVAFNALQLKKA